ncbi:PilC/PilY family type IV pilus protein [Xanthomonas sp. LF06-19]|uniref:pilus assembly protein n=1 Tax=Xanthomonas sp. LF06-19 TaxID=3097551 RepID=UPI002A80F060|nr:PilC/PilY family type IV pilus protein [Xanthomonas sp. LF06-19]MDY4285421.1 PilC/PilY family type IV pilus protein [Xanthomonas sp. LF06-19]
MSKSFPAMESRDMKPGDSMRLGVARSEIVQRRRTRWLAFATGVFAAVCSGNGASIDLGTRPISLPTDIPGALTLVPSVEYPTIISQANLGSYTNASEYAGYFDPVKCYGYSYDLLNGMAYFVPTSKNSAGGHTCSGSWSGNYLNWAATQTIDPFRSALTGGYRIIDQVGLTVLQKARHDRDSDFADRTISSAVSSLTPLPSGWSSVRTRVSGLGREMWFTGSGDLRTNANNVIDYNPTSLIKPDPTKVYRVFVRVKVCDPNIGLESNCTKYSSTNYKPEGLIQEYSNKIRYSIFGYLNDSDMKRDGGVLRARMKFVGPNAYYPEIDSYSNPRMEWDPATGVLYKDPDSKADPKIGVGDVHSGAQIDTSDSNGSRNSGVINYLNKFEELTTSPAKSFDPVSELYYAAIRYFKNLGNVASYSTLSSNLGTAKVQADYFPVITNWDDPIRYNCQVNAILGIGDVNTHRDKNLPGNTAYRDDEPSMPPEVAADTSVNVITSTQKVLAMEGLSTTISNSWTGRNNSAFIAGLAYDSHTVDMRPDVQGKTNTTGSQTVSTYWVDVREAQYLYGPSKNMYWLASKYGGFAVPSGFSPYAATTTGLEPGWWHTNSDTLSPDSGGTYPRPDNFYVASDAKNMVASLRNAFSQILKDATGSAAALGSNATALDTGSVFYQAQYTVGNANQWKGELTAYKVDEAAGTQTAIWSANAKLPAYASRKVLYASNGSLVSFTGTVGSLSSDQVDYIRGRRDREASAGGSFRNRLAVLGDIVNSQPLYVGSPNPSLYSGKSFSGAGVYPQFAASNAGRTPVVYVGGNDGMLHAFNANTGVELFAFVPTEAISKLSSSGFTSPTYTHAYTVDGLLTAADVYVGGAWKSVLVGTMGRGGKSVFALDVTNPASPSLLWEVNDGALGNVLGQPVIAQVADGSWSVLLGNGPNSTSQNAQLVRIDIATGTVASVDTRVGGDNGLSGVNAWSSDGSGIVDKVYAGDLKGNLWRFSKTVSGWSAGQLFVAGNSKPITATPLVARNPTTLDTWVFVGTGRYLTSADLANTDQQTWYGLIDKGNTISASNLKQIRILSDTTLNGYNVRTIESSTGAGTSGWYMDFYETGERMVVANYFQGLYLVGSTRIPDSSDVCSPSGKGYTMVIDPFTGGRLSSSFFDVNGDGVFDSNDALNGVPVSGIGTGKGSSGSTFIGSKMITNLDNASTASISTNASSGKVTRVQWRELIND